MPKTLDTQKRSYLQPATCRPDSDSQVRRTPESIALATVHRVHRMLAWSVAWGIILPIILGLATPVPWIAMIAYMLG